MANRRIPESLIKEAWHSYLTTGNMPASLDTPWFEHKSWCPFFGKLPKEGMESHTLNLKGNNESVDVWVWKK